MAEMYIYIYYIYMMYMLYTLLIVSVYAFIKYLFIYRKRYVFVNMFS